MKIVYLIILISVNRLKGSCIKEFNEDDPANYEFEKTESLSTITTASEKQANDYNDFDDIEIIKSSVDEHNTPDEAIREKKVEEVVESNIKEKSNESLQNESKKSADNSDNQFEEIPQALKSAAEADEVISRTLSEASAESKFTDNENASFRTVESDRKIDSEGDQLEEKIDESNLDEKIANRRMISNHDIVLDTKARTDYASTDVPPEIKIAPNPNTYNNYNEFGSRGSSSLINASLNANQNRLFTPTEAPLITPTPITTAMATQDLFKQQNFPIIRPRPVLNVNFPYHELQLQGTPTSPIRFELIRDQMFPREYLRVGERQGFLKPNNRPKSYNKENTKLTRPFIDKKSKNISQKSKDHVQHLYQLQGTLGSRSYPDIKPVQNFGQWSTNRGTIMNLNNQPRYQLQNFNNNQGILLSRSPNKNRKIENLSYEPRTEARKFHQTQEKMDFTQFLKNKQQQNLSYDQLKKHNLLTASEVNRNFEVSNFNINSQNLKTLYHKLADASENGRKYTTNNSYRIKNMDNYNI